MAYLGDAALLRIHFSKKVLKLASAAYLATGAVFCANFMAAKCLINVKLGDCVFAHDMLLKLGGDTKHRQFLSF